MRTDIVAEQYSDYDSPTTRANVAAFPIYRADPMILVLSRGEFCRRMAPAESLVQLTRDGSRYSRLVTINRQHASDE